MLRSPASSPRAPALAVPALSRRLVAALPAAVALVLWAVAVAGVDLADIDGLGLLSALPPTYFLALALLAAGFAWQASRAEPDARLLATYVVAAIVVLHATAPLLYDAPRYAWVYKHFGVIDFISANGTVDRELDIYHNWPAFFALNAWIGEATGVHPLRYAEWAQVFFGLANVAAIVFAVRGVTRDVAVVWTTAWIFVFANWVGQDYLAPQAIGFVLSTVVLGLALRATRVGSRPRTRLGGRLSAWRVRVQTRLGGGDGATERHFDPPLPATAAKVVGGIVFVAVVLSHQLSPLMLIGAIVALVLVGQRVPLWTLLAMVAIEAAWVALAWPELTERFDLFAPDPTNVPGPGGNPAWGLEEQRFVRPAQLGLLALLVAFAGLGALRRLRTGNWDARPVALAGVPLVVGVTQTYGGESLLRAFLFGLPWMSLLAAEVLVLRSPADARAHVLRAARLFAAGTAIGLCFLVAYYGRELENVMTEDDVAAATWVESLPGDPDYVIASGNFPNRLTAEYPTRYNAFVVAASGELWPRDRPRPRLRLLARAMRSLPRDPAYLVVSPSMRNMARLRGTVPPGSFERFTQALLRSAEFTLAHRHGDAFVFRVRQAGEPRTPPPAA